MSYERFNPPRRIEEYRARVDQQVIEEVAESNLKRLPPKYLIAGEWTDPKGRRSLDIAVNREWVTAADPNYQLVEGRLRWVCPGCSRMSGAHSKGCDYR
jgi:hypothetical protein